VYCWPIGQHDDLANNYLSGIPKAL